jgi:hypothetical protein
MSETKIRHHGDATDDLEAAAEHLRERFPDGCRISTFETTGTVDIHVPVSALPEDGTIMVGPNDAPEGYAFNEVSLHPPEDHESDEAQMMVDFKPDGDA